MNYTYTWIPLVVLITLIVGACSTAPEKPEIQPISEQSFRYVTMGELACREGDYESAFQLFTLAMLSDSTSSYIPERVLEILASQGYNNLEIRKRLYQIGNYTIFHGFASYKARRILVPALIIDGDYDEARKQLDILIVNDPSPEDYYHLFTLDYNQSGEVNWAVLERAIDELWDEKGYILRIADMAFEKDPDKTVAILEKAWEKWGDDEIFLKLIDFYRFSQNLTKLDTTLRSYYRDNGVLTPFNRDLLAQVLFIRRDFAGLVGMWEELSKSTRNDTWRYLGIAAAELGDREKQRQSVAFIVADQNTETPYRDLMIGIQATMNFEDGRDSLIAADLHRISNIQDFNRFVQSNYIGSPDDSTNTDDTAKQRLLGILDQVKALGTDSLWIDFARGMMHAVAGDTLLAASILDKMPHDRIREEDIGEGIGFSYLLIDQPEKAKIALDLRREPEPPTNYLIATHYINARQWRRAEEYLLQELVTTEVPSAEMYRSLLNVYWQLGDPNSVLRFGKLGVEAYPEDSDLLNSLGYALAVYTDEYTKAEELIRKALHLDPHNASIWDSLAWVLYCQGHYAQALEAMKIPIDNGVKNSEVAYHLGEIHRKLKQYNEARQFFSLAISLDSEAKWVELAKEALNSGDMLP